MNSNVRVISYDSNITINSIDDEKEDDFFITCASYESRSLCVFKKLSKDYRAKKGIIFLNNELSEIKIIKDNINLMRDYMKNNKKIYNYEVIKITSENPIKIILKLHDLLKGEKDKIEKLNITLDISTFPKHELLTIVYYLRRLSFIAHLRILYISPLYYGEWLSDGFRKSYLIPFLEGPPVFEKKIALMILTGHETNRAIHLINELEPSMLFVAQSKPGTAPEFVDKNLETAKNIVTYRNIDIEIFNVPANNPFESKKILLDLIKKNSDKYDFYVAPIGPKLTVLGLLLAYEEFPYFRVIYPYPEIYNTKNYSTGCRDIFEISFDECVK